MSSSPHLAELTEGILGCTAARCPVPRRATLDTVQVTAAAVARAPARPGKRTRCPGDKVNAELNDRAYTAARRAVQEQGPRLAPESYGMVQQWIDALAERRQMLMR